MTPSSVVLRCFDHLVAYQPPHHAATVNRRIFTANDGLGDFTMVRGTLQPGGGADPHFHRVSDQVIFVISGMCRVLCGTSDVVLSANDTAFLPRGTPHAVEVLGDAALELHITYLPGLREDDTVPAPIGRLGT